MRICYKREWNAHADRMLNKNSAKLKQYYYFHAEFLEEIRYLMKALFHRKDKLQPY